MGKGNGKFNEILIMIFLSYSYNNRFAISRFWQLPVSRQIAYYQECVEFESSKLESMDSSILAYNPADDKNGYKYKDRVFKLLLYFNKYPVLN